jgi:hypothetical protein
MPDLTRRQCSVARMRGNRRGCAARGVRPGLASQRGRAHARTRRNAGRRERAHCALARTNLRIVPMKTGRLALGGPRLNLCAVECGAAPVRRWVHKARAPGLHARTSSHSTSTSVLPCVLRRPRPARRRQLAQHLHQRPPMRPPSPAARAAAPARTAPPTTSVLPCVLRRPRPARRPAPQRRRSHR